MSDLLKRPGTFKITRDLIIDNPEAVNEVLKDVLVVGVDNDFFTGILTYKGYSKHFGVIKEGEMPPEYFATIRTDDKTRIVGVTWKKLN